MGGGGGGGGGGIKMELDLCRTSKFLFGKGLSTMFILRSMNSLLHVLM